MGVIYITKEESDRIIDNLPLPMKQGMEDKRLGLSLKSNPYSDEEDGDLWEWGWSSIIKPGELYYGR